MQAPVQSGCRAFCAAVPAERRRGRGRAAPFPHLTSRGLLRTGRDSASPFLGSVAWTSYHLCHPSPAVEHFVVFSVSLWGARGDDSPGGWVILCRWTPGRSWVRVCVSTVLGRGHVDFTPLPWTRETDPAALRILWGGLLQSVLGRCASDLGSPGHSAPWLQTESSLVGPWLLVPASR